MIRQDKVKGISLWRPPIFQMSFSFFKVMEYNRPGAKEEHGSKESVGADMQEG